MHDLKALREHPIQFDDALARRGMPPQAAALLLMDETARAITTELQQLQAQRNSLSKQIGQAKATRDEASASALMQQVENLKTRMGKLEQQERQQQEALQAALALLPNLPHPDTPDGADESGNLTVHTWGTPRVFDFAPLSHDAIGTKLGQYSASRAARMSGARFVALGGELARLERALTRFMLDVHTREHGYFEVSPPYLVRENALYGTGQLPKFHADLFHTSGDYFLIPTAEVSLTNLVAGEIVPASQFPLRLVAATPCFRSEAGSAGRDTTGMIRVHQFMKVELVHICAPEQSENEFQHLQRSAETILERLQLPYRKVALCTGDLGFGANRTFDLEVWLPSQNTYREISSCSHFDAFQARRMDTRCKDGEGKNRFVHTLNGSGLAVGRTLVAVLENCQQADGTVTVPDALVPYMDGTRILRPVEIGAGWTGFATL